MKLKDGFITHNVGGKQVLVSVNQKDFSGLVRSNETAAFIIDMLKNDVSENDIINAMLLEYDAEREIIAADVADVISKLKEIGAIVE